ncbi:Plip [Bugula neritina]|uniref:Phosphatidylglycerophosphatase and protein-tyrosine phosphatase 1 n=1 Tax=Bugula neritina TaxID=10212 RepID=A0A7J7KMG5_BUGNE|nr:Plip [Bugula neritina]
MGLLSNLITRTFFYPSIALNAGSNLILGQNWYDRINEYIVLGALPMPFMTGGLIKEKVKGIISLNEDYELKHIYNSQAKWQEFDIKTLRLPTPDLFYAPTIAQVMQAISFIDEVKCKDNGSVYVHCKAGKTRSTTVVICYLMYKENMTPTDAYNFVKSKRPQIWLRKTQFDFIQEFYNTKLKI